MLSTEIKNKNTGIRRNLVVIFLVSYVSYYGILRSSSFHDVCLKSESSGVERKQVEYRSDISVLIFGNYKTCKVISYRSTQLTIIC